MVTIRPTVDKKHETLSRPEDGFSLICSVEHKSIAFEGVKGGMTHCPLCGEKFGEWDKTVRL